MFGIKTRRRLLRENAEMRQALLWYAAKETWRRKGIHQKGAPRKKWEKSPAAYDRGHLAIRVLTQLDDPKSVVFTVSVPAPLPKRAASAPVRTHLTPAQATADVLARGPGMDTE